MLFEGFLCLLFFKIFLLCIIIFILEVFLEFDSVKVNVMSKLMLIGVSGFRFHLCV